MHSKRFALYPSFKPRNNIAIAYRMGNESWVHSQWNSETSIDSFRPKAIVLLDDTGQVTSVGANAQYIWNRLSVICYIQF